MVSNKRTSEDAVKIVLKKLRRKGVEAIEIKAKKGYDIRAKSRYIEVKGTRQSFKNKVFFLITKGEREAIRRHKNYCIYWVDTKNKKIVAKINRKYIVNNLKPHESYYLYLSTLKQKLKRVN